MSKNLISSHQVLRVFNLVTTHGERTDSGYVYEGLHASTDFEGYTIILSNNKVTYTLFFHNKYRAEYQHSRDWDDFLKQLTEVEKHQFLA